MKPSVKVIIPIIILITGFYIWLHYFSHDLTYRHEITVSLKTAEGEESFSTVRQVHIEPLGDNPWPQTISHKEVLGEAVVIHLPETKPVFSIMNQDGSHILPIKALGLETGGIYSKEGLKKIKKLPIGASGELPREDWPQFVYFEDISDPRTIKTIEPDNIDEVLGDGVEIKSISIKITDEKVTEKITTVLTWLPKYWNHKGYLGGEQKPPFNDSSKTFVSRSNLIRR